MGRRRKICKIKPWAMENEEEQEMAYSILLRCRRIFMELAMSNRKRANVKENIKREKKV